jgi:transcriptional regulator with XRE-family HTH domain
LDEVDAWTAPGDILRWWRTDVLGWSQHRMAQRLSVSPTAVSNWEHGRRELPVDSELLDQLLDAGGVLAGLFEAFGSPVGLSSGRSWTKVFPGPSTPVWMWVRSDHPAVMVEGEWGVFSFEADLLLEPNGLFVTVGGSVPDSPAVVQLSVPGWADFGRGELPPAIPAARILDAVDHVRPSTASGVFMTLFTADLQQRLRGHEPRRPHGSAGSDHSLTEFADRFTRAQARHTSGPWPSLPDGTDAVDRQRYATLRKARNLSLVQTADRLARYTDVHVSRDTLRRFEIGAGSPHDQLLPLALDQVLGAEGHLAMSEIRSSRGSGVVTLPPYWHAPIWLSIDHDGGDIDIELNWAKWARRIQGDAPLLVVSHYADPLAPLRVIASSQTRWTVGVGRPPGAIPINHGWVPIDLDAASQALTSIHGALRDAIRRSPPPGQ